MKKLVERIRRARTKDDGQIEIIFRGESEGPDIVIRPDTPDKALGELLTGTLPPAPSGVLRYDERSGTWRDAGDT